MNWISVKDGLPEIETEVLVYCQPNPIKYPRGVNVAHICEFDGTWQTLDGTEAEVTHWMPLPPKP